MKQNLPVLVGAAALILLVLVVVVGPFFGGPAFLDDLIFLVTAPTAIGLAVLSLTRRNPVYSILCLLGVFICMAGLFFVLAADMMAVLQILVYAGAILMVFLFVIMLFNLGSDDPAAEEQTITDRPTAAEAEAAGWGFALNTPKMRAFVFAALLCAFLITPILFLSGERWDRFPPRYGQVEHAPDQPWGFVAVVEYGDEDEVPSLPATYQQRLFSAVEADHPDDPENDDTTRYLRWRGPMTPTERDELLALSEEGSWRHAVKRLHGTARWQTLELSGMTPLEVQEARRVYEARHGEWPGFGAIPRIGHDLFSRFLIPLEFISLILLAGMVGVVVLALRRREDEEEDGEDPEMGLFQREGGRHGIGLEQVPEKREHYKAAEQPEDDI